MLKTCFMSYFRITKTNRGYFKMTGIEKNTRNFFNPNPHWTCKCGQKNQEIRVICLNCGSDIDYH